MSRPTKAQLQRAELAGHSARQIGKKRTQVPHYGHGLAAELQEEAWLIGWDDEDEHIARRREVIRW